MSKKSKMSIIRCTVAGLEGLFRCCERGQEIDYTLDCENYAPESKRHLRDAMSPDLRIVVENRQMMERFALTGDPSEIMNALGGFPLNENE